MMLQKMKSFSLLTLTTSLLLGIFAPTFAQEGWEAGGGGGISYYFGDLNTRFDLSEPGFMTGVAARYNFNPRVAFTFAANYATISADDADATNLFEKTRNLNFQSDIVEFGGHLEFNFLEYIHGSKDHFFTPYLFTGLSIFSFNPKTLFNGELVELRNYGTEGQFKGEEYATTAFAFLFGGGLKVDLSYEWSLNFELGGRRAFTDYIDDVSAVYPDMEDLRNLRGPTAVALSDRSNSDGATGLGIGEAGRQRGNNWDNDNLLYFGVSLMYFFGDLKCPTYSR